MASTSAPSRPGSANDSGSDTVPSEMTVTWNWPSVSEWWPLVDANTGRAIAASAVPAVSWSAVRRVSIEVGSMQVGYVT